MRFTPKEVTSVQPRASQGPLPPGPARNGPSREADSLLRLQRLVGNQATQRWVSRRLGPCADRPPHLQRQVSGDVRHLSISSDWARALTDAELTEQRQILSEAIAALPFGSSELHGLQANARVLDDERSRRAPQATQPGPSAIGQQVLRPAGLPLDGGFELRPAVDLPDDLVAQIPEGRMVTLGPQAAPPGGGRSAAVPALRASEALGAAYAGAHIPIDAALQMQGFAAAGDSAVGLVAIPRQLLNPLSPHMRLPDPAALADVWGHTAMYVRSGGRVTVVRGFNPQMGNAAQILELVRGGEDIVAGARGVGAEISSDAYLFRATASRSIEWPVSPATAEQLAQGVPRTGPVAPGGAQPSLYTADPAAFAAAHPEMGAPGCTGSNCGLWAAEQIEPALGGRIGQPGQPPIMDLGPGGTTVPGAARQGRLIGMMDDVAAGAEALPAGAVVGRMPTYLRYIKWGGRVFMVVGVLSIPAEVYLARPEERVRTGVGATAGFLGGLAAGAAAGLVCGPGALVCSVVLGLGFGIAGAVATRSLAEGVYDLAHEPGSTPVTDPDEQRRIMERASRPSPCPNCHSAPAAERPFDFLPPGPGAPGLRPQGLSPEEARMIVEFLRSSEQPGAAPAH